MSIRSLAVSFFVLCGIWHSLGITHPGRTRADGCHVCRTNCAKWGEVAGASHCHGVKPRSSSRPNSNASTSRSTTSTVNSLPRTRITREPTKPTQIPSSHSLPPAVISNTHVLQLKLIANPTEAGIVFTGTTNLPNKTRLAIVIESQSGDFYAEDVGIIVSGGQFQSKPFTNQGVDLQGEYAVTLLSYFNESWQPKNILGTLKRYQSALIQGDHIEGTSVMIFGRE